MEYSKNDQEIRKLLKEAGLNPDHPLSFMIHPNYSPFKSTHFSDRDQLGFVTVDYSIWSKWLSQTQKHRLRPGDFDMGVNKKPRQLTHSLLYKEIASEELARDVPYDEAMNIDEMIRQKIMGEKSSIKSKLRDGLSFHVDRYGPVQEYELLKP
jgi:hypothetical protein